MYWQPIANSCADRPSCGCAGVRVNDDYDYDDDVSTVPRLYTDVVSRADTTGPPPSRTSVLPLRPGARLRHKLPGSSIMNERRLCMDII